MLAQPTEDLQGRYSIVVQALWVCEFILDVAKNNSLKLLDKPVVFNN